MTETTNSYSHTASEWKKEVEEKIVDALDDIDSELRGPVTHYPIAGGKCTRPVLLFGLTEMLGGEYSDVFLAGAGIEMIHISTLIGDDHPVMDDDDYRRGVNTVHKEFNQQDALLAANLLLSRGIYYCHKSTPTVTQSNKVLGLLDKLVKRLCEGQHYDLVHTKNDSVITEEEYIRTVKSKTAYIYATVGELAVVFADTTEFTREKVFYQKHARLFGQHIGLAHQIFDDALDFTMETEEKDKYSDIKSQTQTLVTIRAHNQDVPVFDDTVPIEERIRLLRETDSISYARETANQHLTKAFEHLEKIPTNNAESRRLITEYMGVLSSELQNDSNDYDSGISPHQCK